VKKSVSHRVEAAMAKVNGQAMRPEKLWGSTSFLPSVQNERKTAKSSEDSSLLPPVEGAQEMGDGRFIYKGRFGRGALIIEDRRKKKPK
jgi:hypothetical protein